MSEILDRIQEHYAKLALENSKEPWRPRPSNLGGCLREMAHRLSGMEPYPNSPESMRTLELGTQRGEALEEIAKTWPFAQTQVEIEVNLGFSEDERDEIQPLWSKYNLQTVGPPGVMLGHLDLWLPPERTIVDFKTSDVFGFAMDYDGGYDIQLQAYRHGIVDREVNFPHWPEGGVDAEYYALEEIRCVLIYESKGSDARKGVRAGALKEVEVPHTEELEERYQQRLKDIRNMLLLKARGALDPALVAGVYRTKNEWRCRDNDKGHPMYCSIGKARGKCAG